MKECRLIAALILAGVVACSLVGPAIAIGADTGYLSTSPKDKKSGLLHIGHRDRVHRHRASKRRHFPPSYAFDFRPTFYVPWVSLHERHYVHRRPLSIRRH